MLQVCRPKARELQGIIPWSASRVPPRPASTQTRRRTGRRASRHTSRQIQPVIRQLWHQAGQPEWEFSFSFCASDHTWIEKGMPSQQAVVVETCDNQHWLGHRAQGSWGSRVQGSGSGHRGCRHQRPPDGIGNRVEVCHGSILLKAHVAHVVAHTPRPTRALVRR